MRKYIFHVKMQSSAKFNEMRWNVRLGFFQWNRTILFLGKLFRQWDSKVSHTWERWIRYVCMSDGKKFSEITYEFRGERQFSPSRRCDNNCSQTYRELRTTSIRLSTALYTINIPPSVINRYEISAAERNSRASHLKIRTSTRNYDAKRIQSSCYPEGWFQSTNSTSRTEQCPRT